MPSPPDDADPSATAAAPRTRAARSAPSTSNRTSIFGADSSARATAAAVSEASAAGSTSNPMSNACAAPCASSTAVSVISSSAAGSTSNDTSNGLTAPCASSTAADASRASCAASTSAVTTSTGRIDASSFFSFSANPRTSGDTSMNAEPTTAMRRSYRRDRSARRDAVTAPDPQRPEPRTLRPAGPKPTPLQDRKTVAHRTHR